jgi:hypothetical protein
MDAVLFDLKHGKKSKDRDSPRLTLRYGHASSLPFQTSSHRQQIDENSLFRSLFPTHDMKAVATFEIVSQEPVISTFIHPPPPPMLMT